MRRRIVVIAGALLGVGVLIAVVAALIETDEEKIRNLVDRMRSAAEKGDVEGILEGVSDEVECPGGRERLEKNIRAALKRFPPTRLTVEIVEIEIDGDRAKAKVVVFYRSKEVPLYRIKFRTEFGRHDEEWLVDGVSWVGG